MSMYNVINSFSPVRSLLSTYLPLFYELNIEIKIEKRCIEKIQ